MAAIHGLAGEQERISRSDDLALALRSISLGADPVGATQAQTLEHLWDALAPLRAHLPELEQYNLATPEGKREFPRTVSGLLILGGLLRACDALEVLSKPAALDNRKEASETLLREFQRFSGPQARSSKLSYDQFTLVVELLRPYAQSADAVATIALALTYGDLCKMPEVQRTVRARIGSVAADHDMALQEAFRPGNFERLSDLFPTMSALPAEFKARIHGEVLNGPNLGHVLQCETCAAALAPLKAQTAAYPDGLNLWFLPTLLDLFAAGAEATKPETWSGSVIGNANLVSAMLGFAAHLPRLQSEGESAFFDGFQREISKRSFYQAIYSDPELTKIEKDVVFRLSRVLSWETDQRNLPTLIAEYKCRSDEEKGLLGRFFMNDGSDPERPKAVVTYLPYVFTQLYAKHLPLPEATEKTLSTVCGLLARIESNELSGLPEERSGMRVYSGQSTWFEDLRSMQREDLAGDAIQLAVVVSDGAPEIILESDILSRSKEMRRMLLGSLEQATRLAELECESMLLDQLSPLENKVFSFVRSHNFVEGAWYRPIHNVLVPRAMIEICERTGASRDLVLAAMLHDVGYAGLKIPGTLEGAKWDTRDVRESHMEAGAQMSRKFLNQLREEGSLDISPERIEELVQIIATHDNPYIGKPLTGQEALLHRDADRAFVISAVSFWKDYLAYLSDSKHVKTFAEAKIKLTPEAFLRLRQGSFEEDSTNTMARFTSYEPMTSEVGAEICAGQLARRLAEIPKVLSALQASAEGLTEMLREIIVADFGAIVRRAQ